MPHSHASWHLKGERASASATLEVQCAIYNTCIDPVLETLMNGPGLKKDIQ